MARITAVLGPTNTGKTHMALERLLEHDDGVIGFPLRLLAREAYDKLCMLVGRAHVALVTGEERIVPRGARWFCCTVESMPLARDFRFVCVDEIQLCADPDRGHVFTDRLLRARGVDETMFLGADTIRPLLLHLVPTAVVTEQARLSRLAFAGSKKLTRLPPRTAVVAFSAQDVYAHAELLRRHRGGAAVVLGALSPRTRNAQVAMFQAGDVDVLVATDAIGMGLNLDVDHVAFAALRKFDGAEVRDLEVAELAQIAGRAGRHTRDGTFGVTSTVDPLRPEVIADLEGHRFPSLRALVWRNPDLDLSSVEDLQATLRTAPRRAGLVRGRLADDERVLGLLALHDDVRRAVHSPDDVQRLWDVCQIPDFRKLGSEEHARLLEQVHRQVASGSRLAPAFLDEQVKRLDRLDGDVDALVARIAAVRTWTYVSFHADWLDDATGAQERTRDLEDRLSDALHAQLTQRFVDRLTSVLVRRTRAGEAASTTVDDQGGVLVEGTRVGHLHGLRFAVDDAHKAARPAFARALLPIAEARAEELLADDGAGFALTGLEVTWRAAPVARVVRGRDVLRPSVEVLPSDLVAPALRERVRARTAAFLAHHLQAELFDLFALVRDVDTGAARGLGYQVAMGLGALPRAEVRVQIEALTQAERRRLQELHVRLGFAWVFVTTLLKPAAQAARATLWAAWHGRVQAPPLPEPGAVSFAADAGAPAGLLLALGFAVHGRRACRLDMLDRVALDVSRLARAGPFAPPPQWMSWLGCSQADVASVLQGLGCAPGPDGRFALRRRGKPKAAVGFAPG